MRNLQEWFEQTAQRFPERTAVQCEGRTLRYGELDARANQVAHALRRRGVGPEVLVGLWADRTLETVIGILGILKAGGAYLPLDAKYPRERTERILQDAEVRLLLVTPGVEVGDAARGRDVLVLEEAAAWFASESPLSPSVEVASTDAAYVIYTSGSTGVPKGVVVEHLQVLRLFTQTAHWYGFGPGDVWTLYHSHSFDVSVWEIFGALLHGGRLVVVPYATSRSFDVFHRLLVEEGVTVLCQTPTAFRYLLEADARSARARELKLRTLIFAGERLDFAMLRGWFERHGDAAMLVNMYGITETTVHSTFRVVRASDLEAPSLIGVPIPDLRIHLLDEHQRPVRDGETGEIYVQGPGVARGYYRRPDLTQARFLRAPESQPGRMYRSGDLARRRADGDIEYIGRADLQVQLRGFRVELGEVEAALLRLPDIRAAAVVVRDAHGPDPKLVAFVVDRQGQKSDAQEVRRALRRMLPDYMVPNRVVPLEALPLTAVGKLDRKALQSLAEGREEEARSSATAPVSLRADLCRFVAAELELSTLGGEDDIFELGATSLTVTNVSERARRELGVEVPVPLWLEFNSVSAVCRALESAASSSAAVVPPAPAPLPVQARVEMPALSVSQLETLRTLMCGELELSRLPDDADFFELGATSLTLANVVAAFMERTGAELGVSVLLEAPTLAALRARFLPRETPVESPRGSSGISAPRPAPGEALSLERLSTQLAPFRTRLIDGAPRRLYASAGGKYAVRVQVEVRPGGVAGLEPGLYAYASDTHALRLLRKEGLAAEDLLNPVERAAHARAPYCLHFVAHLEDLRATYQGFSEFFSFLDTGYMEHLAERTAAPLGLTLRALRGLEPERLHAALGLDGHRLAVSSLVATRGGSDPAWPCLDELARSLPASTEAGRSRFLTRRDLEALYADMRYGAGAKDSPGKPSAEPAPATPWGEPVRLPPVEIAPERYRQRFSHRTYEERAIEREALLGLLSTAWPRDVATEERRALELFVYVKAGRLQGLEEGLYRFAPGERALHPVSSLSPELLKRGHTPSNRTHFAASGFSLFFVSDVEAYEASVGPRALQSLLRESGRMGQRLMEAQASHDVGLVPIGGFGFETVRTHFGLGAGHVFLHGMVGGFVPHARATADVLRESRARPVETREPDDIAIVGMSGRYPGARSLEEFWSRLRSGGCSILPPPESRPALRGGDSARARWGGFLEDVDQFDAAFFGIAPSEADTLEPEARLALETAWEALEDAACSPASLHRAGLGVGVFLGCMYEHYRMLVGDPLLRDQMSLQSYSGIVNRVSHHLDLRGPSVAVDAACASSAIAIHLAATSLAMGECDVALAGGVNLTLHGAKYAGLESLGLLASRGDRAAFGASDGFVPGEGVGILVLKSLRRAREDKDRIHAVIKGSATNHNGRTRSPNMPSPEAQAQVVERALRRAGLSPAAVSYVESSATGSPLGDPVELAALSRVFRGSAATGTCALGSVKGNIGHLEAASGVSQVTKVLLQLKHRTLTPSLGHEPRNPAIVLESTPFRLQTQAAAWEAGSTTTPRVALVTSFAAGGSNACLVLEEHEAAERVQPAPGPRCALPVSARTVTALRAQAGRLSELFARAGDLRLSDVAFTLARRASLEHRLVVLASDLDEARQALQGFASETPTGHALFTGRRGDSHALAALLNTDAGAQGLVERWLGEEQLPTLAAAWTHGVEVDWTRPRGAADGRVVSLPTYPFERRSHWVAQAVDTTCAPERTGPRLPEEAPRQARALLAEVLRVAEASLTEEAQLAELGLTSLLAMRLIRLVEARWAVRLEPRDILGQASVGALLARLSRPPTSEPPGAPVEASPRAPPDGLEQLLRRLSRGELTPQQALTESN
ncbi:amino acid adenylation domain-containing protein [Corallococcus sp. bb12-1]|uniref:amino acid adenylation domain-containing protein n=1 Tax=Corallococcus sp. bb12-1 TaxID=2996784 RepID=UPI0022706C90|nr:amino acid adenylation domain-containing protein [Corallococcus sp. bb12-1]MCY1042398.1 amino acid adenylation domain-containing protein [Corallococcus sp. bb12-1]